MKICDQHWKMLRAEVEAAGMSHLVAQSSEAAYKALVNELQGDRVAKHDFDPLMYANMAIMGAALDQGGLYLMTGDYCPVCESIKNTSSWPLVPGGEPVGEAWVEEHWTKGPVLAQLDLARELGLMPKVQ